MKNRRSQFVLVTISAAVVTSSHGQERMEAGTVDVTLVQPRPRGRRMSKLRANACRAKALTRLRLWVGQVIEVPTALKMLDKSGSSQGRLAQEPAPHQVDFEPVLVSQKVVDVCGRGSVVIRRS